MYLCTFINEYDLNNGVEWHVYHMCAAAVDCAVGGSVVSVAEQVWGQLMHLRQRRGWWSSVRDLVHQTQHVVTTGSHWNEGIEFICQYRLKDIVRCDYNYDRRFSLGISTISVYYEVSCDEVALNAIN